jgi:hypothetical protein
MAIITSKLSIAELRKALGETVVVYILNNKIVMRSRPTFNSKRFRKLRNRNSKLLKEIHNKARLILTDPVKKAEYEAKRGPCKSAHFVLVGELMKNYKSMYYGDSI